MSARTVDRLRFALVLLALLWLCLGVGHVLGMAWLVATERPAPECQAAEWRCA